MSGRSQQQYGGAVQTPRADDPASRSIPATDKAGVARVPRLKLTRVARDRKLSPYFAT
jgi:hypothetical protein